MFCIKEFTGGVFVLLKVNSTCPPYPFCSSTSSVHPSTFATTRPPRNAQKSNIINQFPSLTLLLVQIDLAACVPQALLEPRPEGRNSIDVLFICSLAALMLRCFAFGLSGVTIWLFFVCVFYLLVFINVKDMCLYSHVFFNLPFFSFHYSRPFIPCCSPYFSSH